MRKNQDDVHEVNKNRLMDSKQHDILFTVHIIASHGRLYELKVRQISAELSPKMHKLLGASSNQR